MIKKLLSRIVPILFFLITNLGFLFAEEKAATELNKKVRIEGLSGLNLFLAQTYNNNRFLFALISTGTIIILGLILMYIVGFFIKPASHANKDE